MTFFKKNIVSGLFRHPGWNAVNGITAILVLIITLFTLISPFVHSGRQLVITQNERFSINAIHDPNAPEVSYSFNGVTAKRLVICRFSIINASSSPILASEILEPISLTCYGPYKIAGIYHAENSLPSMWKAESIQKQTFMPSLINPNDHFDILVFITELPSVNNLPTNDYEWTKNILFKWDFRAINVLPLEIRDENPFNFGSPLSFTMLMCLFSIGDLHTSFVFFGVSFWIFIAVLLALLTVCVLLFRGQKRTRWLPVLVVFHVILSALAAENMTWIAIHGFNHIFRVCYIVLVAYVVFSILLLRRNKLAALSIKKISSTTIS